ncbi:cytochrome c oxidase subunit 6a, mitochondrial isoform X1 [Elaeis guineensis]|uniref:cytochrome c oxidase subunit 6a, mitochondrial isoform X1 n=1 Tax=Elaeis guineensis var. tenera TaxID=51953 RepID=UPI0009500C9D
MVILALSRSFINFSHAEARLASTAMAMSVARNGLRALLRGGVRRSDAVAGKRSFSASAHQDDVVEMEKWEKITYVGIITYTVLSIYNLSRDHPHHPGAPPFEYLHVRHKGFRWGPDGLFEKKHAEH